jgi:hypothetical protein
MLSGTASELRIMSTRILLTWELWDLGEAQTNKTWYKLSC